jgi:hypothetical protein
LTGRLRKGHVVLKTASVVKCSLDKKHLLAY